MICNAQDKLAKITKIDKQLKNISQNIYPKNVYLFYLIIKPVIVQLNVHSGSSPSTNSKTSYCSVQCTLWFQYKYIWF